MVQETLETMCLRGFSQEGTGSILQGVTGTVWELLRVEIKWLGMNRKALQILQSHATTVVGMVTWQMRVQSLVLWAVHITRKLF